MRSHLKHSTILSTNGSRIDLKAVSRFHASLQAAGTFKPGEPIQLTINVRAELPTREASIRLFLPEIQALKKRKVGQPAVISAKALKAQSLWSLSLSKGQVFTRQKTITVSQPGYYHVLVSIHAKNGEKTTKGGVPILNGGWLSKWLWVSPAGGEITDSLKYTLFPQNMRTIPGPLTEITAAPQLQYQHTQGTDLTGSITFQVNYLDKSNQQSVVYKPLKNAWIKYKVQYNGGSQWVSKYTNAQGIAIFPCILSAGTYTVKVKNKNNDVKVYNGTHSNNNGTLAVQTTGDIGSDCGQTRVLNSQNSYLLSDFNQVIANSRSYFQHSRGQIKVYRNHTLGGVSGYQPGGDYIVINDGNGANPIGEPYMNFGDAHEYGHALQNKALGGVISGSGCPASGHYDYGAYNLKCAYFEGFADYHGFVTSTNETSYLHLESNISRLYIPYYTGCISFDQYGCTEYSSEPDGPIVEGAVAAFLYDLTDPSNESFDNADYPGSYIADIIQSCQVKVWGNWQHANGIDHIIACLQHQIPYYFPYFPTRNHTPTTYQENAAEPAGWSRTDIATLWYKDLYNEDYASRPLHVSVTGPSFISSSGSYTWQANVADGNGNYSYQWKWKKPRYGGSWTNVGTYQSYIRFVTQGAQTQFAALKVTVTSGPRQGTGKVYLTITQQGCPPNQICLTEEQKEFLKGKNINFKDLLNDK